MEGDEIASVECFSFLRTRQEILGRDKVSVYELLQSGMPDIGHAVYIDERSGQVNLMIVGDDPRLAT